LPADTWLRLVIWLGIGLCIYFAFGYRFSVMRSIEKGLPPPHTEGASPPPPTPPSSTAIKE
jgi:APA family basic amino acid/polyamine antiporter